MKQVNMTKDNNFLILRDQSNDIITQKHKESVNNISIRTASDLKIENCEKTIGMRLARMAYLFKKR